MRLRFEDDNGSFVTVLDMEGNAVASHVPYDEALADYGDNLEGQ